MIGIICLAPVLAGLLRPVVVPLYSFLGADPAMFAGTILANDMGGAPLAKELALTPEAGQFGGLIVGSMLGPTVVFTIPVALGMGFSPAIIAVSSMKRQLKTVRRQSGASDYTKAGSFAITDRKEIYLYQTMSKRARPKDTGRSSGCLLYTSLGFRRRIWHRSSGCRVS